MLRFILKRHSSSVDSCRCFCCELSPDGMLQCSSSTPALPRKKRVSINQNKYEVLYTTSKQKIIKLDHQLRVRTHTARKITCWRHLSFNLEESSLHVALMSKRNNTSTLLHRLSVVSVSQSHSTKLFGWSIHHNPAWAMSLSSLLGRNYPKHQKQC